MRVGLFRRIASFTFDVMPIFLLISLLYTLFVDGLLTPEGYDEAVTEYQEIYTQYYDTIETAYENEDITYDEYLEEAEMIRPSFEFASRDSFAIMQLYVVRTVLYFSVSFVSVYAFYVLALNGRTIGRRVMKIELGGKVTRWRVFVRDVVWKIGYWFFVIYLSAALFWSNYLLAFIILFVAMGFEIYSLSINPKKRALRDVISGTYIKYEGVDYPF